MVTHSIFPRPTMGWHVTILHYVRHTVTDWYCETNFTNMYSQKKKKTRTMLREVFMWHLKSWHLWLWWLWQCEMFCKQVTWWPRNQTESDKGKNCINLTHMLAQLYAMTSLSKVSGSSGKGETCTRARYCIVSPKTTQVTKYCRSLEL
jgi:hypothetical protein